jgi:HK97 family phage prohead protease
MTLETRTLIRPIEVRAGSTGRTVAGYAAVFGSTADIGDSFREIIAPGAFSRSLGGDVMALVHHDRSRVLGRTTAGTLRMKEDDTGLAVEIDLPDTTDGRDMAVSIERGDVSGMSFGFIVTKQTWDETGPVPMRTIEAVDLIEVTITAFPAYADTSIAMRCLADARREDRKHHNQSGYSLRKAKTEMALRGL